MYDVDQVVLAAALEVTHRELSPEDSIDQFGIDVLSNILTAVEKRIQIDLKDLDGVVKTRCEHKMILTIQELARRIKTIVAVHNMIIGTLQGMFELEDVPMDSFTDITRLFGKDFDELDFLELLMELEQTFEVELDYDCDAEEAIPVMIRDLVSEIIGKLPKKPSDFPEDRPNE